MLNYKNNTDLLNATEQVIVQQVNCKGVMGAGLAKQIRDKYPEVYTSYKKACNSVTTSSDLLGCIQYTQTPKFKVFNFFAQDAYGRNKQYTNYKMFQLCCYKLHAWCKANNITEIAVPYGIGCGLAGGDWKIISRYLEVIFTDITVHIYNKVYK